MWIWCATVVEVVDVELQLQRQCTMVVEVVEVELQLQRQRTMVVEVVVLQMIQGGGSSSCLR